MNKIQKLWNSLDTIGTRAVDMSGANSIFGTLGAGAFPILSRMNFIPGDSKGGTISLTGNGDTNNPNPQWIGLNTPAMQFNAYVFCSPLAAIIDRLAEADTNGIIQFIDEDTEVPIKNISKNPKLFRIKKLFKRPNPWQTWAEFDAEQVVLCKIFGCCPVFAIGPDALDRSYTKAFVNLNRAICTPIANEEFSLFKEDNRIKEWRLNIFGREYTIPSKDIILVKDGFISTKQDDLGLPLSKIEGLDFFVSNICAAMEADNVLLKRKGPLGIFSFDPAKDIAGSVPLNPSDKDELQADLARYGLTLGQLQHIISKMPVKWNAMSFNLRDLMTKETIRQAIDGMCDRFGYAAELMSGKNATYENRNSSEKWVYNNNVIPFSLRRMVQYDNFFDLDGVLIRKTFNHIPVLQEDVVRAGEAYNYEAQAAQIEWETGMITWNQWQVQMERDPVGGMDIYYWDFIKQFPQMAKQLPNNGKDNAPKNTGTQK